MAFAFGAYVVGFEIIARSTYGLKVRDSLRFVIGIPSLASRSWYLREAKPRNPVKLYVKMHEFLIRVVIPNPGHRFTLENKVMSLRLAFRVPVDRITCNHWTRLSSPRCSSEGGMWSGLVLLRTPRE
jgi:hypothetical protein